MRELRPPRGAEVAPTAYQFNMSTNLEMMQQQRCNNKGGSVAEWLACWTQAQKAGVQIAVVTLS